MAFTDAGAPIAGCAAVPVADTAASCTTAMTAGSHSIVATYSGDAGLRGSSDALTQEVGQSFGVTGFQAPIGNGIVNSAKAGQAIPVKYRLTAAGGTPVSDPSSFVSLTSRSGNGACGGLPADPVENHADGPGLQYLGDGNWQFNWKRRPRATPDGAAP